MTPKKIFLINMFLKRSKYNQTILDILNLDFQLLKNQYNKITEEDYNDIAQKKGIGEYNIKMQQLVDQHFSQEELEELVKFFSSPLGQKIPNFSKNINKVLKQVTNKVENQLSIKNNSK